MAIKDIKPIDTKDIELYKFQDNVLEFTNQLNKVILDGIILDNVPIGTSTTEIIHKLGRKFIGWQLLDIQGDARVWRDTTSTLDPVRFLPLKASASVTAKLWVF